MPRIPVRIEPYNSPTRQHRHFKSKRDLVLRSLGKSAFINGSQFAIIWVTARGETECYGSDAFQPKLATWFHEGVCADAVLTARQEQQRVASQDGAAQRDYASMLDASDRVDAATAAQAVAAAVGTPGAEDDDPSTDDGQPADGSCTMTPDEIRHGGALSAIDPNSAADVFGRTSDPFIQSDEPPSSTSPAVGRSAPRRRTAVVPYVAPILDGSESVFEDAGEVTAYMAAKVAELQQNVCKLLAKAWIKVIEPKKPTTHPYSGGDETKPSWWPEHVRHKESDTLLKPERIDLLVAILTSPHAGLSRLELASGEMSAFIPTHKHAVLRDIYNVARAYENMRRLQGDSGVFSPFTVSAAIAPPVTINELPASPPKMRKRPRPRRAFSDSPYAAAATGVAGPSSNGVLPPPLVLPPPGPMTSSACGPLSAPLAPSSPWYLPAAHTPEGYYPSPPPPMPNMSLGPAWDQSDAHHHHHPSRGLATPPCTSPEPSHLLVPPPRQLHPAPYQGHIPTAPTAAATSQQQHQQQQVWSSAPQPLPQELWPPEEETSYFPPQPQGPTSASTSSSAPAPSSLSAMSTTLPAPAIAAFNRFEPTLRSHVLGGGGPQLPPLLVKQLRQEHAEEQREHDERMIGDDGEERGVEVEVETSRLEDTTEHTVMVEGEA